MSKHIILITGASSGIGAEFARQVDTLFPTLDEIWLIARRKEKLEALSKELTHKVKIIPMDVVDDDQRMLLQMTLQSEKPSIRMLINSAGFGMLGKFENSQLKDQLDMVHLNCSALLAITYICLPYMKRQSRLIQMASSAAFLPQPGFGVYAATKSFVLSFSQALREELRPRGIYVTAVCPGPVETEFFEIAERTGSRMKIKNLLMKQSKNVVTHALKASYHKKDIAVYGGLIKSFHGLSKLFPHPFLLKLLHLAHE